MDIVPTIHRIYNIQHLVALATLRHMHSPLIYPSPSDPSSQWFPHSSSIPAIPNPLITLIRIRTVIITPTNRPETMPRPLTPVHGAHLLSLVTAQLVGAQVVARARRALAVPGPVARVAGRGGRDGGVEGAFA